MVKSGERRGEQMIPHRSYCGMPMKRFRLFADLGILTVPEEYEHATQLETFQKNHRIHLQGYNCDMNDVNFSRPSRILKPGDRFSVRAYKQIASGTVTSEECLAFLETLNSHYVGAQGATLVFEQKRDQLPKGVHYLFMDERNHLWIDNGGSIRVPKVQVGIHGDFCLYLDFFEDAQNDFHVLLSFCDVSGIRDRAS